MKENLVIIGNGFDLECSLKSSYGDFFKNRISTELMDLFNEVYKIYLDNKHIEFVSIFFSSEIPLQIQGEQFKAYIHQDQYQKLRKANLTFWDLVFLTMGMSANSYWHNVEDNIRLFLDKEIDRNTNYSTIGMKDTSNEIRVNHNIRFCCILAFALLEEDRYKKSIDIYDFLYKELRIFEKDFTEYLMQEFQVRLPIYTIKFPELMQAILGPDSTDYLNDNYSILSFNYTRYYRIGGEISNIHGTLQDENIIFGIDQKSIRSDTPEYRFTKTFRKLTQVNKSKNEVTISGKDKLKKIFFYGHSLSELDYSYFQSIFDYYDIYSSEVKLIFCCTHFDKNRTKEEILQAQTLAASKLIETYGSSMGKEREQHGKNLLHKLMLEDRVDVRIIRPTY
ncbi:AbiH family protein [Enterococcus sp. DIV1297f]|uniref:AbiH family protein n=1 Tax=Enterococcus sp. DIV1297f TaxID=2774691 RepID=UPI003D2E5402